MTHLLHLDPAARAPLYRQLADKLAERIADGSLPAGTRLMSVREMAIDLRINPNTVARAYREMELAGWVTTQAGKGVFVAEISAKDQNQAAQPDDLSDAVDRLLSVAETHGLSLHQLISVLKKRALLSTEKKLRA